MKAISHVTVLLAGLLALPPARAEERGSSKPTMVDASTGWWHKITDKEATLLHTQDGGRHWADVSPEALQAAVRKLPDKDWRIPQLSTLNVLDAQRAWVSILSQDEKVVRLEFTADGGQHWLETMAPIAADQVHISFGDERRGFLLALGDPAAGLMDKKVYGTEDGGQHWHALPPPAASTCYPTGISFRSPLDGWITATYHGGDAAPLYRSTDGGQSWRLQALPIPADYRGGYVDTYPPVFLGRDKKEGHLPVKLVRHEPHPGHIAWVIFESHDGGETWHLPASGVKSVAEE